MLRRVVDRLVIQRQLQVCANRRIHTDSRRRTFGDYMTKSQTKNAQAKSAQGRSAQVKKTRSRKAQAVHPPSGYHYFAQEFPRELSDFTGYLKRRYPDPTVRALAQVDYEMFNKLETYKRKGRKPRLFVTMMKRNPGYLNYIVWQEFGLDMTGEHSAQDSAEASLKVNAGRKGSAAKKGSAGRKGSADRISASKRASASKPTKSLNSSNFTDLLHSLHKVRATSLPPMTPFTPAPTRHFPSLEADLRADNLEGFLAHAQEESQLRRTNLFKAQRNYEWAAQQGARNPRTLESHTFFTPVLVPGTTIPIEWVRTSNGHCACARMVRIDRDGGVSKAKGCAGGSANIYGLQGECASTVMKYLDTGYTIVGEDSGIVMVKDACANARKLLGYMMLPIVIVLVYIGSESRWRKPEVVGGDAPNVVPEKDN